MSSMKRRWHRSGRWILFAVHAACAMIGSASSLAHSTPDSRPNVIVILADDAGLGDTGAYGGVALRTPNIDALAMRGVRFSQGCVSHPVCSRLELDY